MEPGWKGLKGLKGGAGTKTMLIVLSMAASIVVVVLREESPFAGSTTQVVLALSNLAAATLLRSIKRLRTLISFQLLFEWSALLNRVAREPPERIRLTEKPISKNSTTSKSNYIKQQHLEHRQKELHTVANLAHQLGVPQSSDENIQLELENVNLNPPDSTEEAGAILESAATENINRGSAAEVVVDKADSNTDGASCDSKKEKVNSKMCDYSAGKWLLDQSTRPLYRGENCSLLSYDWICRLHKHPDALMDRYRWQPDGCDLPVFNPSAALEMLRNKVIAIIGDSLGRQQYQSLLCLLTTTASATSDASARFNFTVPAGARRPPGWAVTFHATNTTLLFKWTTTLTRLQPPDSSNPAAAVHVDRPDQFLEEYLGRMDIVVLNTGHHWNEEKMRQLKGEFWSGGRRVAGLEDGADGIQGAYERAVRSVVGWVHRHIEGTGKVVYYRSLSPKHFENGDWNTGGTCDTIQFDLGKQGSGTRGDPVAESAVAGTRVRLLNITALSMPRGEAHVSKYGPNAKLKGIQDCLHWCLPGVPDTWNEIFLAELASTIRCETTRS